MLAAPGYKEAASLMEAPQALSGSFEQIKHLTALDTEIVSSGQFAYERDARIISWHTLMPIESLLILTPETITSEQSGTVLSKLEARNNPVVALFSDIFFGVMTARWSILSDHFDVQTRIEASQWQATLIPREASVEQVVSRVELQGDVYLREIVLHETGGDRTRIRFYGLPK
ncbi:hypothetical protein HNR62_002021 [Oceanisphaera litoralis]|uniref:outer membrane lipoprotein carrier protein LolA n=1 Tax=Oceanisphaera litoralis TaxID=225144 RepID=UPI001958A942|nr:outer membrane lipoprotein carrier protein LolA [Oceanisphaera litoralis]MBM7456140.1 hypothetical protein [Oceanisphaera litoralis]